MKTLLVYSTRYGGTAGTSEEIARILSEEGFKVKIVNAKEEKVKDISEFEFIIVGGGLQMSRWTSETEDFLKTFQRELAQRKVAIFVSSAMKSVFEREEKKEDLEKTRKMFLDDRPAKYGLKPIAVGLFGGIVDYNRMGLIERRAFSSMKARFEAAGFKETKPGVYDTRDWDEIRDWARKLVLKARYY
jgi:menaquinone-dependent protoporphyrinogen IX oxidase